MHIFEMKPWFSQETGELFGTFKSTKHHLCDYCGEVIKKPNLLMPLDYEDGTDTRFGLEGNEVDFVEEHGVDIHDFLSAPYCFCNHWNGRTEPLCEQSLAQEFLACAAGGLLPPYPVRRQGVPRGAAAPLRDIHDLQGAFRAARIRAAAYLIADGTVTLREMGLEEEGEDDE